jgi:hypothetical protein
MGTVLSQWNFLVLLNGYFSLGRKSLVRRAREGVWLWYFRSITSRAPDIAPIPCPATGTVRVRCVRCCYPLPSYGYCMGTARTLYTHVRDKHYKQRLAPSAYADYAAAQALQVSHFTWARYFYFSICIDVSAGDDVSLLWSPGARPETTSVVGGGLID